MSVEMSLDEIIALNRKKQSNGPRVRTNRTGYGGGGFRSRGPRGFGGGGRRRSFDNQDRYVDLDAVSDVPVPMISGNPNKTVRVNLANLAPTVVSSDLEELFADYGFETATVHYNESGESCGTGDVYMSRKDAERACRDFAGVALDGKVLKLVVVDGNDTISSRLRLSEDKFRGDRRPFSNGGVNGKWQRDRFRSENRSGGGGRGRGPRNKPVAKTTEELDAELDEYMSKGKH